MSAGPWTRRRLLSFALAAPAVRPGLALAATAPRVAALDWGLGATAIELGLDPVGVAEQALYRAWVGHPALPAGAAELGLRTTPSLEALALLKPDLILINPLNEALRPRLERIAPTFVNTTFNSERRPLERSTAVTRSLGDKLGRPAEAEVLVAAAEADLVRAKARLAATGWPRPLLPVSLIDGRHLLAYGAGSLYGDVLGRLGLRNGFARPTGPWGSALCGVDDLAKGSPTDLVVLDPVPPEGAPLLAEAGLLRRLLAARGGRLYRLPPAWAYGGIAAAARFAALLADALAGAASGRGGGGRPPARMPA